MKLTYIPNENENYIVVCAHISSLSNIINYELVERARKKNKRRNNYIKNCVFEIYPIIREPPS